jgi:hypothetical protein
MVAVIDERPWFKERHGDTVLCWMHFLHFLAARPQHAKSSFRFGMTYRRIETFWTFAPSVRRFLRSETSVRFVVSYVHSYEVLQVSKAAYYPVFGIHIRIIVGVEQRAT